MFGSGGLGLRLRLEGGDEPLDRRAVSRLHDAGQRQEELRPGVAPLPLARLRRPQPALDLVPAAELDELPPALPAGLQAVLALVLAAEADEFLDALRPE